MAREKRYEMFLNDEWVEIESYATGMLEQLAAAGIETREAGAIPVEPMNYVPLPGAGGTKGKTKIKPASLEAVHAGKPEYEYDPLMDDSLGFGGTYVNQQYVPTAEQLAMRKHPLAECERCSLCKARYVPSEGPVDATMLVVGEAPGHEEVAYKRPFIGLSGKVLNSAFEQVGIDRENTVWLTNAALCRPPGNKINDYPDAPERCRARLEAEILEHKEAQVIVAAGRTAAEQLSALTGHTKRISITKERGQWMFPMQGSRIKQDIMLTVHPAYVLRTPSTYTHFRRDLLNAMKGPQPHPLQQKPKLIVYETIAEFEAWAESVEEGSWLAFDVETAQTHWFDRIDVPKDPLLMLALCNKQGEGVVIPSNFYVVRGDWVISDDEMDVRDLCCLENSRIDPILEKLFKKTKTTAHNGKFDWLFLRSYGHYARVDFDTMLAHYALDEVKGTHGLKQIAAEKYGVGDYEGQLVKMYLSSVNDKYDKIPFWPFAQYAVWDVAITLQLREDLENELKRHELYHYPFQNVLMKASERLAVVEFHGMMVDVPYLYKWKEKLEQEQAAYLDELRAICGKPELNPNSSKQLAVIIYDELGFVPPATSYVPHRSTGKKAIELIGEELKEHPIIVKLGQYRRVTKILVSYIKNILNIVGSDGRVHCSYLIHGTETGRLSAREPALQTIPRGSGDHYGAMIRGAFTAPPGRKLVFGDYSQAELRIWGAVSHEPFLLKVFEEGRDLHSEAALMLYGEGYTKENRMFCKFFNFAYAYGGNEKSFAGHFQLPLQKAIAFVHEYEKLMPGAKQWRWDVFKEAKRRGYCETVTGRRRRFPLITPESVDDVKKSAANMPIQGAASDLDLLAACELVEEGYEVVILVHDSIGIECDEADAPRVAARLEKAMMDVAIAWFPEVKWKVDVDIQDRWTVRPDEDEDALVIVDGEVVKEEDLVTLVLEAAQSEEDVELVPAAVDAR